MMASIFFIALHASREKPSHVVLLERFYHYSDSLWQQQITIGNCEQIAPITSCYSACLRPACAGKAGEIHAAGQDGPQGSACPVGSSGRSATSTIDLAARVCRSRASPSAAMQRRRLTPHLTFAIIAALSRPVFAIREHSPNRAKRTACAGNSGAPKNHAFSGRGGGCRPAKRKELN